jgi:hypothetical protein
VGTRCVDFFLLDLARTAYNYQQAYSYLYNSLTSERVLRAGPGKYNVSEYL